MNSAFLDTTHGKLGCTSCHGGSDGTDDKTAAHQGVVKLPSTDADKACGKCHAAVVKVQSASLHSTLRGFQTILATRSGQSGSSLSKGSALEQGYENHCGRCHGSCGSCHVSRPAYLDAGLLAGHQFKKTPPMKDSCIGCHATRVGSEYLGQNEGVSGDVHWTSGGMTCAKCHGAELHGTSASPEHRYASGQTTKQCKDCHPDVVSGKSQITQHNLHGDKLSCQVCHSVDYKSCYGCHVGVDANGTKYFRTDGTEVGFRIGLNPLKTPERPYKYVTLRHAPVDPGSFDFYGKNLLSEFATLPTWRYATPHNIQRQTPQNQNCDSCHGNDKLFLKASDLKPGTEKANQSVLVPAVPPKMGQ